MKPTTVIKSGLILSIEAAVRGGSIALTEDDREVAIWHGTENVSRAEDLLSNISGMFDRTGLDKHKLQRIAVSNGPGSYTGIRIGLATALGLARALNVECVGVPLLPALAEQCRDGADCVVVIPIGRNELCWQKFDKSSLSDVPRTGLASDLFENFPETGEFKLLMQHDAFETAAHQPAFEIFRSRACNLGRDLALAIGIGARDRVSDLNPNYVRNSQFSSSPV